MADFLGGLPVPHLFPRCGLKLLSFCTFSTFFRSDCFFRMVLRWPRLQVNLQSALENKQMDRTTAEKTLSSNNIAFTRLASYWNQNNPLFYLKFNCVSVNLNKLLKNNEFIFKQVSQTRPPIGQRR